jgi:hypothetical protein
MTKRKNAAKQTISLKHFFMGCKGNFFISPGSGNIFSVFSQREIKDDDWQVFDLAGKKYPRQLFCHLPEYDNRA